MTTHTPTICTNCGGPIAATPLTRGRTVCQSCAPLALPAQPPAPTPRPPQARPGRKQAPPSDDPKVEASRAYWRDYRAGIRHPRQPKPAQLAQATQPTPAAVAAPKPPPAPRPARPAAAPKARTTVAKERKPSPALAALIPAPATDQELIGQWLSRRAHSQHPLCHAALGALRHETRAPLAQVSRADIDAAVESAGELADQKARRKALANLFHLVVGIGWRADNPAEPKKAEEATAGRTALIWRDRQPHGALVDSGLVVAWDWTKTRAEVGALIDADRKARPLSPGATRREYEVVEL